MAAISKKRDKEASVIRVRMGISLFVIVTTQRVGGVPTSLFIIIVCEEFGKPRVELRDNFCWDRATVSQIHMI